MSRAAESATERGLWRTPLLAKLGACLRSRADSEHELTINRLAVCGLVFVYLIVAGALGSTNAWEVLRTHGIYFAMYCAISIAFFVDILCRPAASPARRMLGILVDFGTLSWVMHVGGQITSLLYPMYLWVIFGNGFRFGLKYLFAAMVVGVAGFTVVIETTEYWRTHLELAAGLLTGLIILPLYAATLIRKLSAARQQAEAANQAKSQFLASVSHELRTPLNAIIGLSDLLRDARMDDEHREMTRTIGTASRSLLALINSLLDFSRIEQRCITSNPVDFDLHALLADARAILSVAGQEKSVRLALHVTARTPRFVKGDKRHLEEILLNLGGNAVKFTERGSVVIAIDAVPKGDHIRLRCEVSDTGIGIAPEAQARIFDSFTQADETIIDRFGGTGLGLAIVKQLVEFHNGVIGVDSEPGAGSTFWLELDVATATAKEPPSVPSCGGPGVVLLSPNGRLHELAATVGADVRIAATGEEAGAAILELMRRGVRRPVVVFDAGRRATDAMATAKMLIGDRCADAPAVILVADEPVVGLLPRELRSLFVTALVRPVDGPGLAAALSLARGNEASASADEGGRPAQPSTRKLRILVAEDNRTNQMVIAKILERAGHEVHLVDNGEAALDALDERVIDIVLMDVNMPVMNGIEAARLYRFASPDTDQIPIVALTADATAEAEARCLAAGMNACLTKPVEAARILQVIETLTLHRARGGETPGSESVAGAPLRPDVPSVPDVCVDRQKLDDLKEVGGDAFVAELVAQFSADAAAILRELSTAAADQNVEAFRDRAHALRSGAANIGAYRVYDLCLAWRQIGPPELAASGIEHVARLREELDRVGEALDAHVAALRAVAPSEDEGATLTPDEGEARPPAARRR
jgi:two-component system sensor histidine kinase RpfC